MLVLSALLNKQYRVNKHTHPLLRNHMHLMGKHRGHLDTCVMVNYNGPIIQQPSLTEIVVNMSLPRSILNEEDG